MASRHVFGVETGREVIGEAIQNARESREGLTEQALDRYLGSLVGNPIFYQWRSVVLDTKRVISMSDEKTC